MGLVNILLIILIDISNYIPNEMDDHSDIPMSESVEHSISTPPVAPSTTAALPPHPNKSSFGCRNWSAVWNHLLRSPVLRKRLNATIVVA